MKRYIRAGICVIFSYIKFSFIKLFHFNKFKFSAINLFSPFTEIDLSRNSNLLLNKFVKARSGVKIKVRSNATVEVGENTSFNHGCMIVCREKVTIGKNVQFGPNVLIYDHDHDFRAKNGLRELKYKNSPITIGDNVWVGANTVILRGTNIGDNCVVGAGTVVKGKYSRNSIIVQKREELVKNFTN